METKFGVKQNETLNNLIETYKAFCKAMDELEVDFPGVRVCDGTLRDKGIQLNSVKRLFGDFITSENITLSMDNTYPIAVKYECKDVIFHSIHKLDE